MSPVATGEETRARILKAAADVTRIHGFQAASLNEIIKTAETTKGAFYHHFESKTALGYALVDEYYMEHKKDVWSKVWALDDNPVEALVTFVQNPSACTDDDINDGCPVFALAQEMAQVDEEFRRRLERVNRIILQDISTALAKGQATGQVREDVDPWNVSLFMFASFHGMLAVAKNFNDPSLMETMMEPFMQYVNSLRP